MWSLVDFRTLGLAACSMAMAGTFSACGDRQEPTVGEVKTPKAVLSEPLSPVSKVSWPVDAPDRVAINWDRQRAGLVQPSAQPRETFDREAYRKNPSEYLHRLDWDRQYQVAQEGPEVRSLLLPDGNDGAALKIAPGERVALTLCVDPGWPATFASPDRGVFDNGLPIITVQADANGLATAHLEAIPGTVDRVVVVVASPVHSGSAGFNITIVTPSLEH